MASERVADLVNGLIQPWTERVEYTLPVCVHTAECTTTHTSLSVGEAKHYECTCPVRAEKRVERVTQPSILAQLDESADALTPGLASGARGTKPCSRPPATLDMLDLLCTIDVWLDEVGSDATSRPARLRRLVTMSGTHSNQWTFEVCLRLARYTKTARIMLNYDAPKRSLRDVVCGECGSTLVVAIDASSDVGCVGGGCGKIYRQYEWVDLID
jgi:hypothetical protein